MYLIYYFFLLLVYIYGVTATIDIYDDFFETKTYKKFWKILFGICWPIVLLMCIWGTIFSVFLMWVLDKYHTRLKRKED